MFGWFRRRNAAPPRMTFDGRTSDDWKAGDLAQCVCGDWPNGVPAIDPKWGEVRRVSHVQIAPIVGSPHVCAIGLFFVGYPQDRGWHCLGFRKIRPASDEFTTEIRKVARRGAKQPERAQ